MFQASIECADSPIEHKWQVALVVHALWPDLAVSAVDIEPICVGTWLIPVPQGEYWTIETTGLGRTIDVEPLGQVEVEIPPTL